MILKFLKTSFNYKRTFNVTYKLKNGKLKKYESEKIYDNEFDSKKNIDYKRQIKLNQTIEDGQVKSIGGHYFVYKNGKWSEADTTKWFWG